MPDAISRHHIFLQVHVKKTTKFRGVFLKVKNKDEIEISWSTQDLQVLSYTGLTSGSIFYQIWSPGFLSGKLTKFTF